jgi:flagellar assembly factor FliW
MGPDTLADQEIAFPDGIPGFPGARRFALGDIADGGGAFQLLQSLDDPDLAMIVTVPWLFFPDYAPELDATDERELGLEREEDAVVFCAVTADPERQELSVNLLGPFVVNARTRVGRQVVLGDDTLPVRAPLPVDAE